MRSRPRPLVLQPTTSIPAPQPVLRPEALDALLSGAMHNPQLPIEDRIEAAALLLLHREPVAGHA
jgi:hypothetical protein